MEEDWDPLGAVHLEKREAEKAQHQITAKKKEDVQKSNLERKKFLDEHLGAPPPPVDSQRPNSAGCAPTDFGGLARTETFYERAQFLSSALEKRPSILDLHTTGIVKDLSKEGPVINSPAKNSLLGKLFSKEKGKEKEKEDKGKGKEKNKGKEKEKDLKKVKKEKKKQEDNELATDWVVLENPQYKESFSPDASLMKALGEIYKKKQDQAVELVDSEIFWDDSAGHRGAEYHSFKHKIDEMHNGEIAIQEVEGSVAWRQIQVPSSSTACSQELRLLIRKGIPDRKRREVWKIILDVHTYMGKHPQFYVDALQRVFGSSVPSKLVKVPTFGGTLKLDDHFLTAEGKQSARRILVVLALERPEVEYCPCLPDLVSIFLHFLSEEETYTAVHLMLKRSTKDNWYMCNNKKGNTLFFLTFKDLIESKYPEKSKPKHIRLYKHMENLKLEPGDYAYNWFNRFFVSALPYHTVLRIFDVYLNEGCGFLCRVGLALLKLHHKELIVCETKVQFLEKIASLTMGNFLDDKLMKTAISLDIEEGLQKKYEKKYHSVTKNIQEPHFVYYRPKIEQQSTIIQTEDFEVVWSFLPDRYQICDPTLLYSSALDGFNISRLFEKTEYAKTLLLLFKTKSQMTMGFFLPHKWTLNTPVGSNETVLFSVRPKEQAFTWKHGQPPVHVLINHNSLSIGGGAGTALWLDKDLLNGRSEKCSAFGMQASLCSENFQCIALEAWSIA